MHTIIIMQTMDTINKMIAIDTICKLQCKKKIAINTILLTILNNIYKIAIQSNDNNEYNAVNNT